MTIFQSYTTQMVLLGTALLGLASGIAGTFAVLRKESLIGDGLSHAALPGVVIAFLLTGIKDIELLADRHQGHRGSHRRCRTFIDYCGLAHYHHRRK